MRGKLLHWPPMSFRKLWTPLLIAASALASERELVFSDGFAGAAIDASKWTVVDAAGNAGQRIEGCYTPEGVQVSDGSLHLVATKTSFNDRKTGRPCSYRSGRIESKFQFLYGRIEFRAKLPRGKSYWPALWLRTRPADGPISDEIDVIEGFGSRPEAVQSSVHRWDRGKRLAEWCAIVGAPSWKKHCGSVPPVLPAGTDLSADYHVYAADWSPGKVTWSLDGKDFYTASEYSPKLPMVIVMNLAVGGTFDGAPDETTPFPMEMVVDWVRVYRDSSGQAVAPLPGNVQSSRTPASVPSPPPPPRR